MSERQRRGVLTSRIEEASERLLGYKISQGELRLMPYIAYVVQNTQILSREKINESEEDILADWMTKGFLLWGERVVVSKAFWDAMAEIIWLGYVCLEGVSE